MADGYWFGRFSIEEIDTTPGSAGPFAPPTGFKGSQEQFRTLMLRRYRNNHASRQQLIVLAYRWNHFRCNFSPEFIGPYALTAKLIVNRLSSSYRSAA